MPVNKLLAALALMGAPWPAGAQIELNPPKPASVITVDVDLVNLLCSVRDQRGAFVKGLSKEDFEIRQDGKRQTITHFAREVDSPMTVALLLDVSGSVAAIIGTEKTAAGRFFDEALRPGDQALLVGFAQQIAVLQELTPSKERLQASLERAGPGALPVDSEVRPRGGTLLYDAVTLVASRKLQSLPGRKTIILITDGLDNGSIANIAKAVEAAHQADAVVYAIHFEDEQRARYFRGRGMSALEQLSTPTGGRAFHVDGKTPLPEIFSRIVEAMRNQYGLGFTPPADNQPGQFHKLQVTTTRPGLKAQARTGYYSGQR
jgi:Ca-activated chloride channel family protein